MAEELVSAEEAAKINQIFQERHAGDTENWTARYLVIKNDEGQRFIQYGLGIIVGDQDEDTDLTFAKSVSNRFGFTVTDETYLAPLRDFVITDAGYSDDLVFEALVGNLSTPHYYFMRLD